jgi:subtilase family serine protease
MDRKSDSLQKAAAFVRGALSLFALLFALETAAAPLPASPPARVLITQAIDPAQSAELAGNTRPEALNPGNDRGRVADDFVLPDLLLQLRRPADREIALEALIDAQQDPASPQYHQWLSASDFGALFGPAQQDIDTVVAWLQAQGFAVERVYESGMTIAFSGTAGVVHRAFATEIHALDVDGRMHYANIGNPRIPAALAPAVRGVVALHDFKPRANSRPRIAPEYSIASGARAVVPADLATIYNLTPLFSASNKGSGITIALIEASDIYALADFNTFRSVFGLGTSLFSQTHPGGCTDPGAVIGLDSEATLDVEWAAAAAPAATLQLVSCANLFDAMANLVNANATPPDIMSISFGECEAALGSSGNAFVSSTYQQALTKGISVFVSSGDQGAAGCFDASDLTQANFGIGVNGLASTPYNVAVGGTDFGDTNAGTTSTYWNTSNTAQYGSAKSYINEIPWNDSCASKLIATFKGFATTYGSSGFCNNAAGVPFLTTAAGSGGPSGCATGAPSVAGVVGGSCAGTAKPSWQTGFLGNPNDHVRDIPDVSLFAANGVWNHYYVFCFSDPRPDPNNNNAVYGKACTGAPSGWAGAGGTSFSAPIMAGIQALVEQKHGNGMGNPNPAYYQIAAAEYGAAGSATCNSSNGNGVDSSCVFYDVTQGDIDVNCATGTANCYRPSGTHGVLSTSTSAYQPAYGTTTGWDFATGLGSINAANLVANWPLATKLKFTTQPVSGAAGSTLAAIKVSVENASGNAVVGNTSAVTIKFGSNPGGATLGGTLTVNAVNGVATFSNITINKTGTGYTLVASDGSLTGDTSNAFNITPGAAAKVLFTSQPPSSTTAGASFATTVTIQDSSGNVATGNTSAVTLALTTANGATLGGTKTLSAVNGVAAFTGLSIDKVGSYTLSATDGALTSAVSNSIAISHGAAAKLAFTTQPPASIAAGASFGVGVTVQDAAGNTVTGNGSAISLALTVPAGATLGGLTVGAAVNGTVTINGLSVDKAGSYTLTATDAALTPAVSSSFTITIGVAAKLVFTTQPIDLPAGILSHVVVAIEDASGNIESGDNATQIKLVSSACTSAPIASATVAGGVAQFNDLRLYKVGSGRQLQASSTSLSANSASFNVSANSGLIFANAFGPCLP